jgi:trehalose 6-phosphate phosphatase
MCAAAATTPSSHISVFFHQLQQAESRLLMLDYDGTIAPFTTDRKRAVPYPSIPELLDSISCTCRTRLVLISGRSARDIQPLLGVGLRPEIWGAHGLERLYPDGRFELAFLSPDVSRAIRQAETILEEGGLAELCEIKTGAIAVHWRGLHHRHLEDVRTQCYRLLAPLTCHSSLLLTEFDGGVELKARLANKGDAVRTLLDESNAGTVAAYLGDDVTDEDAFRALDDRGLSVLVRNTYRTTAAQLWLKPPGEVVQFLNEWIHACGGDA